MIGGATERKIILIAVNIFIFSIIWRTVSAKKIGGCLFNDCIYYERYIIIMLFVVINNDLGTYIFFEKNV